MEENALNQHSEPPTASDQIAEVTPAKPPRKRGRGGKAGALPLRFRGRRHGLTAGSLPAGCSWVQGLLTRFRTALEDAVYERKQEVSLYDASVIQSAIRWERHAILAGRWLRMEEKLTVDQRVSLSREVARGSSEKDRCLRELGLHLTDSALPDILYRDVLASIDEASAESTEGNNDPQAAT